MELLIGDNDAVCLLRQLYHEPGKREGVTNDPITIPSLPQSSGKMNLQFHVEVCWTKAALGSQEARAQEPIPSSTSMQPSGITTSTWEGELGCTPPHCIYKHRPLFHTQAFMYTCTHTHSAHIHTCFFTASACTAVKHEIPTLYLYMATPCSTWFGARHTAYTQIFRY